MISNPIVNNKETTQNTVTGENQYNFLTQTFEMATSFAYQVILVSSDFIARPDLLSKTIYDTPIYGDILCKINGLSNPFELNEGMKMIIPEYSSIESFYYKETYDVDAASSDSAISSVKTKTDKRSANEAIIGDTRFKVDSTKNIVIY